MSPAGKGVLAMGPKRRRGAPPIEYSLLLTATMCLIALGAVMVFSASSAKALLAEGGGDGAEYLKRTVIFAAIGLLVLRIASVRGVRMARAVTPLLLVAAVLLLAAVLVPGVGQTVNGAQRWIGAGLLQFQPSEIAKVATVFVLARRLSHPKLNLSRFRDWFTPLLLALVPFALVAEEPDLGTSLSFPAILIAMFYWAGMSAGTLILGLSPGFTLVLSFLLSPRELPFWITLGLALLVVIALVRPRRLLLATALLLNLGVAFAMPIVKERLHDYQLRRIETFLNPDQDPHGAGYQIIQSRIAIGSGGLLGKGWLQGTQKGLSFLPMRHTDFIFAVVGEERGLLGALTVVIL